MLVHFVLKSAALKSFYQKNMLQKVARDFDLIMLSNQLKEVSIEQILTKICVSPPYFAFQKIYQYQDLLIAPITPEQPQGNELGKISITEAGRHLAILGSCLLALN